MLNENFIYVGALLNLIGSFTYLRLTLTGGVKPNRVTWFLWTIVPFIAFTAQIQQGVGLPALTTFMTGFIPLLIFLASFVNKKSYWKLSSFDIFCGFLSLMGILLWYITRTGNLAIIFSILADALAATPTIVKSFKAPETEDYKIFLLGGVSALLTLLSLKNWTFASYGWALYALCITTLIGVLIKFRIGKLFSRS